MLILLTDAKRNGLHCLRTRTMVITTLYWGRLCTMFQRAHELVTVTKDPQYTGANRCFPCTVVNLIIAATIATLLGVFVPSLGLVFFAFAVATIWLRGYLIPGTPELTKQYFPEWLLRWFGKAPPKPTAADVDPGEYLQQHAFIVEDEAIDDLVINPIIKEDWWVRVADLSAEQSDKAALSQFSDLPASELTLGWEDDAYVARIDEERIGSWESRSAFVADMAAHRVFASQTTDWDRLFVAQRAEIVGAFRLFIEQCPTCEGTVTMDQDVVESCCFRYDVIAGTCQGCGDRLFELRVDLEQEQEQEQPIDV